MRCGRTIEYRKKWARDWDQVRYCGEKCRRERPRENYGAQILELLNQRARGTTICPSELLRPEDKQIPKMMEDVRRAARVLVAEGKKEITQKGQIVVPSAFRGPIRLRLKD